MRKLYKHKIRILLGLVFTTITLALIFQFIYELKELKSNHGIELTFRLAVKLIYNARTFFNPVILGIAMLGLLIPREIGWIMTANIFVYFIALVLCLNTSMENRKIIQIAFIIIFAVFYGLMNLEESRDFYKIEKKDLLTFNLIAITTGLGSALLKGYFILNPGQSIYEILMNMNI